MRDELRSWLDGERSRDTLSPEAAAEAEAWERLTSVLREDVPGPAPLSLEAAVMEEVRRPRPGLPARARAWLVRPSLSPLTAGLTAGLAAAAIAALLVAPWREAPAPAPDPRAAEAQTSPPTVVYVQFVLEAPGARSVAVAGDFNGWDGRHELGDPDGDGVWTGRVPIRPGMHQYMFVLDGTEWVTDPAAERWTDDGFGNRNAVLAVTPPGAA